MNRVRSRPAGDVFVVTDTVDGGGADAERYLVIAWARMDGYIVRAGDDGVAATERTDEIVASLAINEIITRLSEVDVRSGDGWRQSKIGGRHGVTIVNA